MLNYLKIWYILAIYHKKGRKLLIAKIFAVLVTAAFSFSLFNGTVGELSQAVLEGAQSAVELVFSMLGMMCLWSGVIKVMDQAGVTKLISKISLPVLKLIFPDSKNNEKAMSAIAANFAANLLGLGNAALPLGLTAVKELSENENHTDIMTFSVLNTVPIQLFPATLITLRKAAGSASPYSIILPIWAVSFITYLFTVLLCRFCGFIYKRKGKR